MIPGSRVADATPVGDRAGTGIPSPPSPYNKVTVTKNRSSDPEGEERRCGWCGRRYKAAIGPGRPRLYCRRSCRQRDYEARMRAAELGLSEHDLVVTRQELSRLDDLIYVLACAVEDVDRDLSVEHDTEDVQRALRWLMEAARPLASVSALGRMAPGRDPA